MYDIVAIVNRRSSQKMNRLSETFLFVYPKLLSFSKNGANLGENLTAIGTKCWSDRC